jgi:hypothetical protein
MVSVARQLRHAGDDPPTSNHRVNHVIPIRAWSARVPGRKASAIGYWVRNEVYLSAIHLLDASIITQVPGRDTMRTKVLYCPSRSIKRRRRSHDDVGIHET